jgi:RNA polymerase sigma factor (sigma-70 family)
MAAGDAVAVEAFYRRYFALLYRHARRATSRDESFCLDVVQEAMLRILRCVRPVADEVRFRAWLGLVVKTTAYDMMKAEMRRGRRELAVAAQAHEAQEPCESETQERMAWLVAEIRNLDEPLARIIGWRYEDGRTLRRIAERLGLSVGTVDGRLRRAIRVLQRKALEVFDDEQ